MNKVEFTDWELWYLKIQLYPATITHIKNSKTYRAVFNGAIVGQWDFSKKSGWIYYYDLEN